MTKIKVKFAFQDWVKASSGESVYESQYDLTMTSFHGGTVFNGEIELSVGEDQNLAEAIKEGFNPVLSIYEIQS